MPIKIIRTLFLDVKRCNSLSHSRTKCNPHQWAASLPLLSVTLSVDRSLQQSAEHNLGSILLGKGDNAHYP